MLPYSPSGIPLGSSGGPATGPRVPFGGSPETPFYKRTSFIIALSLGLIVVAGAAFSVYYLFFRQPPPNLDLKVVPPDHVLLGEPFTLTVSYQNNSPQTLQAANISLTLPDGISAIGVSPSTRVSQQDVGDLPPQGIGSRTFQLIATDGDQSVKSVSAAFRYQLNDNSNSRFEKDANGDVAIGAPAIAVNFNVPAGQVFAGQDFSIGASYQNNSQTTFDNTKLFFDYPQNFQYASASGTQPSSGNNEWDLGGLAPAAQGAVQVTGHVTGGAQTFFTVGAHLQVDVQGQTYTLAAQTANVGVSAPLLSVAIVANGDPNLVASPGEQLTYTLTYANGAASALKNVVITAKLSSAFLDPSLIISDATLDSVNDTLTWNAANTPALANVDPGQSGKVQFQVRLMSEWPIHKAGDKNFTFNVHAAIQSLTVPAGVTADQTRAQADIATKIGSETVVSTFAYYHDPVAVPANTGPYPPQVDQPTQYTIHWQLRTYGADLQNGHFEATLQSGAKMVSVLRSTAASQPVFDPQTGRVTWDLGSIPANTGATTAPLEAVFRIVATPAANQVGADMPLVSDTLFTATDAFTGARIQEKALAKTSAVPDDSQGGNDRKVRP